MALAISQIKRAQQALTDRYYHLGAIDGIVGKKTLSALRAFLFEHDLVDKNDPAPSTLTNVHLHAIEAAPVWARLIDVSHWQDGSSGLEVGTLSLAKDSGIGGVFIKAGGADEKSGDGLYQDSEYRNYTQQARTCGLIQGAYFFHHFTRDPVAQAEKFFRIVGSLQTGDLPPALDLEDYKTPIQGKAALNHVMRCLERIEQLFGVEPILYTSASLLKTHYADLPESPLSQYDLWIPAYGVKSPAKRIPTCFNGVWRFWQTGYDNNLPGFNNDVDRNFFQGTLEELRGYCIRG